METNKKTLVCLHMVWFHLSENFGDLNTFRFQCIQISDSLLYNYIQECEDWMLDVSLEQSTVIIHTICICVQFFFPIYIPYLVSIGLITSGLELGMKEPPHWPT